MEPKTRTGLLVCAALMVQLMTAGCLVSGGSFFSGLGQLFGGFFSGSHPDEANESSGISGVVNENILPQPNLPGEGSESNYVPPVAVLHNPEPVSLILFGGGLAGLALIRRRRPRKNA